jgi:hypothetical protein
VLRRIRCGRLRAEDRMTSGHAGMFVRHPIEATGPHERAARARHLDP